MGSERMRRSGQGEMNGVWVFAFLVEQPIEIKLQLFLDGFLVLGEFYQLRMTYDVVQMLVSHFSKTLPHFLGDKREVVDQVFIATQEMFAQSGILRRYTHWTRIEVALTHHHATQHDEGSRSEGELISTEQRHDDDVAPSLQLAVNLQSHARAQTVLHKRLLRLAESYLWRDTRKAHTTGRTGTRTTLSTTDDNEVGLCLGNTSRDGSHATLRNEFHGDSRLRVDVTQVENQLRQVFYAIDVVMGWGRNQTDTRNGMTRLGNHLIHLESR